MKKLINNPADYVDEALDGLCSAFSGYRRTGRADRVIARTDAPVVGKVGVVTGGGFGHLPVFAGYVGDGMLDACAVGNVFAGPPVDICAEALRAADGGAGVLCVLGNYGGDRMSFAQACDEFADEGGTTATVIVADDVASAPASRSRQAARRRGHGVRVQGRRRQRRARRPSRHRREPRAAHGRTHALDRRRAVAVPHPRRGGAGISGARRQDRDRHGHPRRARHRRARRSPPRTTSTDAMVERLLADGGVRGRRRVAVLVNSLGATPLEELLIVYRHVERLLRAQRIDDRAPLRRALRDVDGNGRLLDLAARPRYGNRHAARRAHRVPVLAALMPC